MVRFSTLHAYGSESNVRVISQAAIRACPYFILSPKHYRDDETCRCDDPTHLEMRNWGYEWRDGRWS